MADPYLGQDLYVYSVHLPTNSLHNYGSRGTFTITPSEPTEEIADDVLDQLFGISTGEASMECAVEGFLYRHDAQAIINSVIAGASRKTIITHPEFAGTLDTLGTDYRHRAPVNGLQRVSATSKVQGSYRAGSTVVHPRTKYAHGDVSGIGGTKTIRVKTSANAALAIPDVVAIVNEADPTISSLTVGWTPIGQSARSVAVTPTQRLRSTPFAADAAGWNAQARSQGTRDIPFTFAVSGTGDIRFSVVLTY